jgi:predicted RNase H-like HicB family nuclease
MEPPTAVLGIRIAIARGSRRAEQLAARLVLEVTGMAGNIDAYTVVIRPDDNGSFVAYVPAIEGCHAWGLSPDQARAELAHVFEMITDEYQRSGRPLPPDVELAITRAS